MPDSTFDLIAVNLSEIESIVQELPRVGKRPELKDRADEILRLTEVVWRLAYSLNQERQAQKYVPNLATYGIKFPGEKSTEGGKSCEG
jgi:hypothetical protein